eukprot:3275858-Pyramimonas_sp.AAC.1
MPGPGAAELASRIHVGDVQPGLRGHHQRGDAGQDGLRVQRRCGERRQKRQGARQAGDGREAPREQLLGGVMGELGRGRNEEK